MLSVTTYLSTNIAPIPLLWVIPLALYLLTFILVFTSRPLLPHFLMCRALPIALLPLVIAICAQATQPIGLLLLLHLLAFFVITMVCHGAMAADRPPARQLTAFYLWISAGGALGGMFNALLAPSPVQYGARIPAGAGAGLPAAAPTPLQHMRLIADIRALLQWLDIALPLGLGALVAALILATRRPGCRSGPLNYGLIFGLPALLCFSFSRRPQRFALGVAGLFVASTALHQRPRADHAMPSAASSASIASCATQASASM